MIRWHGRSRKITRENFTQINAALLWTNRPITIPLINKPDYELYEFGGAVAMLTWKQKGLMAVQTLGENLLLRFLSSEPFHTCQHQGRQDWKSRFYPFFHGSFNVCLSTLPTMLFPMLLQKPSSPAYGRWNSYRYCEDLLCSSFIYSKTPT